MNLAITKTRFQKFSSNFLKCIILTQNGFILCRLLQGKVSVDAFSLLYAKMILAKFCLLVFDATFAELFWQFISICRSFIRDLRLSVVKRAWPSG